MKVLISDYPESMMPYHDLEIQTLTEMLGPDLEVEIYGYSDEKRAEFLQKLSDVDGLLTAFVQIDKEALDAATNLKIIGINATGYDNVDLEEATRRKIGVSPVGEYCTWDVSEAALAYVFALNKHLKHYINDIEVKHVWDFASIEATPRLENQTVGIFGFGKIGKCTAQKISPLVSRVIAHDPYVDPQVAADLGVELVDKNVIYEEADIIINHMNLTEENKHYFGEQAFAAMKKTPIFINLGRGLCVDEDALVKALDDKTVRAVGVDVLSDETPDLEHHPLVGRENVIITPHSAFYSTTSLEDLMVFSSRNIAYFLLGQKDKVFKLVNEV